MPRSTAATLAALAVLGVGAASGCVDRAIHESVCGDGRLSRGELCLGEGDRSTLTIASLAPLALRVADFHGDGPPDLMVLGTDAVGGVTARLWLGDGEGGFAAPPLDPGIQGCSAHPVPGAIDDDASTDLLVADCAPSMSLFRGTPSGVFDGPVTVQTGVTTVGSGLFDIDADGLREVLVLGPNDLGELTLSVSERDATGAFAPAVLSSAITVGFAPTGMGGLLDFDGDPFPDILLVQSGVPQGLAVAHGEAGLRFGAPERVGPLDLVVDGATTRDLDRDGTTDVLAVSFTDEIYIALRVELEGTSSLLVERARTRISGLRPGPAALADLDDDGREDLLRVDSNAAALAVHLGRADGRFDDPTRIDLDTPADQLAVADLDDDGALDIVVGSFEAAVLRVLLTAP